MTKLYCCDCERIFAKSILQTAYHYINPHVAFENVLKANVAWLVKEEKWSTYVMRLLAEEQTRGTRYEGKIGGLIVMVAEE